MRGNANFYLLQVVTDSNALARWLAHGTDLTVVFVPDLRLQYQPTDAEVSAGAYFFHAPEPAPLPFEINGMATDQRAQGVLLEVTWWESTRRGVVRLAHPSHMNFVSTGTGKVRALDRAMETILGAESPSALVLSERIESFTEEKTICVVIEEPEICDQ